MILNDDPFHAFMPYEAVPVPSAANGPLSGLTFAVKDIYDVAGYRTGCGCPLKLAASPVKTANAAAVQALLDAGATFAGKVHTDELAWSMYGMNAHFGTPVNPAAPKRIPGGSSSGSAVAVAAGLVDFSIGTDTGGSVRAPASFCGIWGLRPTHGRIALSGCMELAASFDTCGPFARDPAVLEAVTQVLLGEDTHPIPEPEFLWPTDMIAALGDTQASAIEAAFAGTKTRSVSVYGTIGAHPLYDAFLRCVGADIARSTVPFIFGSRMPLARGIDSRAKQARDLTPQDIATGHEVRHAFMTHIKALLGETGVILAPNVHDIPFELDAPTEVFDSFRHHSQRLLCVAGMAGLPQVALPAGHIDGAPYGVSLIGPRGSDLSLIRLAAKMAADRNMVPA